MKEPDFGAFEFTACKICDECGLKELELEKTEIQTFYGGTSYVHRLYCIHAEQCLAAYSLGLKEGRNDKRLC